MKTLGVVVIIATGHQTSGRLCFLLFARRPLSALPDNKTLCALENIGPSGGQA
jgi:hypothetical protein